MAKTVNVWIDGNQLEVPDTMTIIEAADKHGFYIPRRTSRPAAHSKLRRLRGGSRRQPNSQEGLLYPRRRRHEDYHQYQKTAFLPQDPGGNDPLQPRSGVPHLRGKQQM